MSNQHLQVPSTGGDLVVGRKRSRDQQHQGPLAVEPAKRRCSPSLSPASSELCLRCSAVDFHGLIDFHTPGIQLCTLYEAGQNPSCPFCCLVVRFSNEKSQLLDEQQQQQVICSLRRRFADTNEYLIDNIRPYARLMVTLRHRCIDGASCHGDTCPRNYSRLKSTMFLLDRLETPSSISADSDQWIMVRRPISKTFDPQNLVRWLSESETAEYIDHLRRHQRNSYSPLEPLMKAGRFRVFDVIANKVIVKREIVNYIALSYVWGEGRDAYVAASSTKCSGAVHDSGQGSENVDLATLPRVIQDAAALVRAINHRFLWIDALCIQQDSPEDKTAIIPQMNALYGEAWLTIVAACGSGAESPLSRLRYTNQSEEHIVSFETKGKQIRFLPARPTMDTVIQNTTWASRGWTLQERLLSQRCIFFTEHEVYFRTLQHEAREAYEYNQTIESLSQVTCVQTGEFKDQKAWLCGYSRQGRFDYHALVWDYTSRSLSHQGDRLDAFIGLADAYHLNPATKVIMALSELPFCDFGKYLLWRPLYPEHASRIRIDARSSRFLPSWSWAGWTGQPDYESWNTQPDTSLKATATVVDEANIKVLFPNGPSDFKIERCEVQSPLHVTLHVWVLTASARVAQVEKDTERSWNCSIELIHESNVPYKFGSQIRIPEGVSILSRFEVVALGEWHLGMYWLIVTAITEGFAERVGMIQWTDADLPIQQMMKYFKHGYVRLR